jgi:hypothetical protein
MKTSTTIAIICSIALSCIGIALSSWPNDTLCHLLSQPKAIGFGLTLPTYLAITICLVGYLLSYAWVRLDCKDLDKLLETSPKHNITHEILVSLNLLAVFTSIAYLLVAPSSNSISAVLITMGIANILILADFINLLILEKSLKDSQKVA